MALTQLKTSGIADDAVTTDKLANAINTERTANTAKVSTTINNNADNRVITGSGTANTLNGESGLVYNGYNLAISGTGQQQLNLGSTNAGGVAIILDGDSNGDAAGGDYSIIRHNTDGDLEFYARSTGGATNTIFKQGTSEKVRIHSSGTLQAYNHATSRNGIVQINQVTSTTRYSGSPSSVDLITGSTFTPKTSAPRFLIMIFCPVNTSDDSDAGNGNTNFYFYGRLEYRKNGGSWLECNNQGSTAQQGGYAAHVELSPNRTGPNTTDYWSGNRYRTESKTATILVTNVGDCGLNGTVQFKLRSYTHSGNFIQIGQPWGFTVFELAPDSNSYTAY